MFTDQSSSANSDFTYEAILGGGRFGQPVWPYSYEVKQVALAVKQLWITSATASVKLTLIGPVLFLEVENRLYCSHIFSIYCIECRMFPHCFDCLYCMTSPPICITDTNFSLVSCPKAVFQPFLRHNLYHNKIPHTAPTKTVTK